MKLLVNEWKKSTISASEETYDKLGNWFADQDRETFNDSQLIQSATDTERYDRLRNG